MGNKTNKKSHSLDPFLHCKILKMITTYIKMLFYYSIYNKIFHRVMFTTVDSMRTPEKKYFLMEIMFRSSDSRCI